MQGRDRRNPRMALPRHPGEGRFRPRNRARTHAPVQPGTQAEGREMTARLESALEILRNCWCRWRDSNPRPTHYERSEEHTSELQSREKLVCRLLLEKKKRSRK